MNARWTTALVVAGVVIWSAHATVAGQRAPDNAAPTVITIDQLPELEKFEGRPVQITVLAHHVGSERLLTFGKNEGREVPVLLLNPSIDTANLGDAITITGTVRRFDPAGFAREYSTFRSADYRGLPNGTIVIVASSLRSPEGGQVAPASPAEPARRRP